VGDAPNQRGLSRKAHPPRDRRGPAPARTIMSTSTSSTASIRTPPMGDSWPLRYRPLRQGAPIGADAWRLAVRCVFSRLRRAGAGACRDARAITTSSIARPSARYCRSAARRGSPCCLESLLRAAASPEGGAKRRAHRRTTSRRSLRSTLRCHDSRPVERGCRTLCSARGADRAGLAAPSAHRRGARSSGDETRPPR